MILKLIFTIFVISINKSNQFNLINEIPTKLSTCKVQLSSGKLIDLTPLDKPNDPR